jgi:hypothetical protein
MDLHVRLRDHNDKEDVMTTTTITVRPQARPQRRPLLRAGAFAGVVAAVSTTVLAALARAIDVPLEIEGEVIPLLGFAQLTLVGAALGVGLAALLRRRPPFVAVTVVATALSFVPSLALPDDTATRVVLVVAHVVAAVIIVPVLARRLPADGGS